MGVTTNVESHSRRRRKTMRHIFWFVALILALIPEAVLGQQPAPKQLATGLKNPESVAVAPNGKVYASVIGEFGKDGDGAIMALEQGKAVPFCQGLDDPKGLAAFQQWLYVADKTKVLKIDAQG